MPTTRPMLVLSCVALGGAIGALARHGLFLAIVPRAEGARWVATLSVNLLGCLAIGILWRVTEHHGASAAVRALVFTGMLASFTTFSTFGLDAVELLHGRRLALVAIYVGASVAAGIVLVKLGHDLTGLVLGSPSPPPTTPGPPPAG